MIFEDMTKEAERTKAIIISATVEEKVKFKEFVTKLGYATQTKYLRKLINNDIKKRQDNPTE